MTSDLGRQIGAIIALYNNQQCHEILNNVILVDVYFGRYKAMLRGREKITALTIRQWRLQHYKTSGAINRTREHAPPMLKPL